jgi:hypothetical protein
MNIYKWVINKLYTIPSDDDLTDIVKVINWTRIAKQGDINVFCYGCMTCETPSSTDFTAYDDLTYEQVCSWLDAGTDVISIDLELDKQIENIINPPIVVLPLPWIA